METEPQEGAASRFVVTTPAGLEAEARRELRQVLPGARFEQVFLKGNLLAQCDLPELEALARLAEADTTVVASVTPVQRRLSVAGEDNPAAAVASAAAEVGRIGAGETFLVRCRRRGTHPWHGRDLERGVAARLAEITGGVGEYQTETAWQVTIQVFQDTAYVGVNRPEAMLEKELHRHRKYAPGERPLNRAQWKLKEALSIFGLTLPESGRALDLGSAPGGWAAVLAELVHEVVAVDPAELDPEVAARPNVRHVRARAETLLDDAAKWGNFDFLTSDMNRDPAEVARLLCQLAPLLRPGAPAVMTVKYPTPHRKQHEREAREALSAEFEELRIHHLPHNARETTVAMRRKGGPGEAPK